MIAVIFVRRLRPGVTYEEFKAAWMAEPNHFGVPVTVTHAQRLDDDREIFTYAFFDASRDDVAAILSQPKVADGEAQRHSRIDEVLESTVLHGLYEVLDATDLT